MNQSGTLIHRRNTEDQVERIVRSVNGSSHRTRAAIPQGILAGFENKAVRTISSQLMDQCRLLLVGMKEALSNESFDRRLLRYQSR